MIISLSSAIYSVVVLLKLMLADLRKTQQDFTFHTWRRSLPFKATLHEARRHFSHKAFARVKQILLQRHNCTVIANDCRFQLFSNNL